MQTTGRSFLEQTATTVLKAIDSRLGKVTSSFNTTRSWRVKIVRFRETAQVFKRPHAAGWSAPGYGLEPDWGRPAASAGFREPAF